MLMEISCICRNCKIYYIIYHGLHLCNEFLCKLNKKISGVLVVLRAGLTTR